MGQASHESYASALARLVPDARIDHMPCVDVPALPTADHLSGYDAIFFAGSPIQMHDGSPQARSAAGFMRSVFDAGTPSFGSCAGLQIAVTAAGGMCGPRDKPMETAFARGIVATPQGRSHPLLDGRPVSWDAPAMHSSIVRQMPRGGTILASARHTPVEAAEIRSGNGVFWGVQYHPELTIGEIAGSLKRQSDALIEEGLAKDEATIRSYAALLDALHEDPDRADIAWRVGVDEEVLDDRQRQLELSNFLRMVSTRAGKVMPG
ncbi:glutamine amidotransferase-related protein [Aureimonas frigidaquae]|uniref:Glutamine amidotransferase class-I n=1 Tax=Aureimonas frigidaquae TaxID=424757 RepID=A0A0N7KY83_9HYPH|nr:gamma-glutamyl-gamma-aminobutyrate hydrolase family protein [Aureimonas frigidaquae]BAT29001.1 glutamine amidotransferase class-I [Aureimonas frigidaquae]